MTPTDEQVRAAREWLTTLRRDGPRLNWFANEREVANAVLLLAPSLAALLASREAALVRERDELAMRAREVTCVWCGYQFQSTLKSQAEHLYEHAKVCDKHPIRIAQAEFDCERDALQSQVAALREALRTCPAGYGPHRKWYDKVERVLRDTATAAREHDERIWNRGRDVGERDGYILCQNALQKLGVERLRRGQMFDAVQEYIDALSRIQPKPVTPTDSPEVAAREHDERVRADEREACAREIENMIGAEWYGQRTQDRIAAAIRARHT